MKKSFAAFLIALGMVSFGASAFAWELPSTTITDSDTSFGKVSEFGLDQTPWLYLSMPEKGVKLFDATWTNGTKTFSNDIKGTFDIETWLTNTQWNSYSNSEKLGTWTVESRYAVLDMSTYLPGPTQRTLSTFKVMAPEPISAALFLLGGAGLGIKRFFIKK